MSHIKNIRRAYDALFALVDRERLYENITPGERPPIVNLGYWDRGATTAREAQENFVAELASRWSGWKDARVLDAGCGLGGPATILTCDYGARVEAININEGQVRWARRFAQASGASRGLRIHLASAMDLPFPAAIFDVVFSLEAAHCFADKPRFLADSHRVLRPDGVFLFADIVAANHLPLLRWQPAIRLNLVSASDWRNMLEAAGFRVQEQRMIGYAVYPGCRRWAAKTAGERRAAIIQKRGPESPFAPVRAINRARAWILEFMFFRSVLLILSKLKMREYVLFVAVKRSEQKNAERVDAIALRRVGAGNRPAPRIGIYCSGGRGVCRGV